MYAIVRIGGRQYRAEVDGTLDVDRLPQEVGAEVSFDEVLLIGNGDSTVIGQPMVEGASVRATIEDQFRDEKIIVFKYRQRTNYRRKKGHRQYYTRLRINDITV